MPTKIQKPAGQGRLKADSKSSPKTTHPPAAQRREKKPAVTTARKLRRTLDAMPDRIDVRDWFYQPSLAPLPDILVSCDSVPQVLDQGQDGACTGFALAGVINFLLHRRNVSRLVSPRMLYEIARRYDEWPGEGYEGSSARGAMKGWARHGVANIVSWPTNKKGLSNFTPEVAKEALRVPGGAYYRVMHRQVRDMHAALAEVEILYVTLMVHEGWAQPGPLAVDVAYVESNNLRTRTFPVIQRKGRAEDGHAVAIVGYTQQGFIIQNSWGQSWGAGGFALLPYEDYMLHATDVWVAQLGVPVTADLWVSYDAADTTAGIQRATPSVSLDIIRPYVVDIGNNGLLSASGSYWTTESDLERLFTDNIPTTASSWAKRRLLIYLHGGLNDEDAVARRIVAFRDVFLQNEIYPLHIMWESGAMETFKGLLENVVRDTTERAGADWMKKLRDGLVEAKDRTLELTLAAPGGALWKGMKENCRTASDRPDQNGAVQLLAQHAKQSLAQLPKAERAEWELHVVGHSAGSIFAAYAMSYLVQCGVPFKTLQFMAPAMRMDLFKQTIKPLVDNGTCPHPTMYILSDEGERDDDVGPYGKSLLYLVSNAFEGRRETPLLGMQRFIQSDTEMTTFFDEAIDGHPSLIIAGDRSRKDATSVSESDSHGGFDNDPATLNSILWRILGQKPARAFTLRDLQY